MRIGGTQAKTFRNTIHRKPRIGRPPRDRIDIATGKDKCREPVAIHRRAVVAEQGGECSPGS